MEWQPIETAPKSAETVLAYFPDNERTKIALVFRPDWENAHASYRCPVDDCYYVKEPTHWMPLPAPPTTKQPEEK